MVKRTGQEVAMQEGRDFWYASENSSKVTANCPAKGFDSEHPLYILYTSGSTGKPKGILHTSGGYLTGTYTARANTSSICRTMTSTGAPPTSAGSPATATLCTARCQWRDRGDVRRRARTGRNPTASGRSSWRSLKVTILYTAPTAIRAFIKWGDEHG